MRPPLQTAALLVAVALSSCGSGGEPPPVIEAYEFVRLTGRPGPGAGVFRGTLYNPGALPARADVCLERDSAGRAGRRLLRSVPLGAGERARFTIPGERDAFYRGLVVGC